GPRGLRPAYRRTRPPGRPRGGDGRAGRHADGIREGPAFAARLSALHIDGVRKTGTDPLFPKRGSVPVFQSSSAEKGSSGSPRSMIGRPWASAPSRLFSWQTYSRISQSGWSV